MEDIKKEDNGTEFKATENKEDNEKKKNNKKQTKEDNEKNKEYKVYAKSPKLKYYSKIAGKFIKFNPIKYIEKNSENEIKEIAAGCVILSDINIVKELEQTSYFIKYEEKEVQKCFIKL